MTIHLEVPQLILIYQVHVEVVIELVYRLIKLDQYCENKLVVLHLCYQQLALEDIAIKLEHRHQQSSMKCH